VEADVFVNRFIKTLHNDVKVLHSGKKPSAGIGPFLFPSKNADDPTISFGGDSMAAAEYFLMWMLGGECQYFDFGTITNEQIKDEGLTVAEGFEHGLVDMPADICWMEHNWTDEISFGSKIPTTSGYLYVRKHGHIIGAEIRRYAAADMHKSAKALGGRLKDSVLNLAEYYVWDGFIMGLPLGAKASGYTAQIIYNATGRAPETNNLFDPLMTMLGRLSSDGITQRHVPASQKLNRRRAAKGIPGIVAYTEVKITPSRPVLGHSGPQLNERAPTRHHFRRGHVRHFQNGEVTWVRPCFVGDPADGIIHHTYRVDT
jgi:hypothetical protein